MTKKCSCGIEFELANNRQRYCKTCAREKQREQIRNWRSRNQYRLRAYNRYRYYKHLEKYRAYARRYWRSNREKNRERCRKWFSNNPQRARAYQRKYYIRNKPQILAQAKAYRIKNVEQIKARKHMYYELLPDWVVANYIGLETNLLPPELIALKREHIKLGRLLKAKI